MSIRNLTGESIGALNYDQAGFDIIEKDERDVGGEDHVIFYPGVGTNVGNRVFANNPEDNAYWIGIHNVSTDSTAIPIPVQAESLVGDDFTKVTTLPFDYDEGRYINLAPGDIVYGKFKSVGILKSAGPTNYKYRLRMIRGV